MKKLLPVLGVVFLAQILFVGLIHVFLIVQDKNSPETLATLSRLPVIGGFFPDPGPIEDDPTAGDKQDADLRRLMADGDELFVLPREISAEQIQEHIESARRSRRKYEEMTEELESEREALEISRAQVKSDQDDVTNKIEKLAELERELEARWEELDARKRVVDASETRSYARLGEIYSKMPPARVATIMQRMKPIEAAKLMATIEARFQGKIFAAMDMGAQIDIQKHMLKPTFRPSGEKTDTGGEKKKKRGGT